MNIPNNMNSLVEENKITEYLLNSDHETGRHKAKFFKQFGFDLNNIEEMRSALIQHSIDREIFKTKESSYGCKYELQCDVNTPDERNPCIITVWIIEKNSKVPRLVTAYPSKEKV